MEEPQSGNSTAERLNPIEQRIVDIGTAKPNGFDTTDIMNEMPNLTNAQLADVLNKLLKVGRVAVFQKGKKLMYKLKTTVNKGLDTEEKIIYSIIESAGNKGIWMQNIRRQANLSMQQVVKIVKGLESKKLIKTIKSVTAARRVVYMLYNLEPDRSVTGGAWYQDQDFEAEFVEVLNQQCYRFFEMREENKDTKLGPIPARNASVASSKDVTKYIADLGISKVPLSVQDVEVILNTLVYDGKIEWSGSVDGNKLYRRIQPIVKSPGLILTPCGLCPVMKNCHDNGEVSPSKCQYLRDWLESSF